MKLIIGLGNPGRKYQHTRHNIGFISLDQFAKKQKLKFKTDKKFKGEIIKTKNYILLKPTTYMNLSGDSVNSVLDYFGISLDDILVIYDDLDLPPGKLRLRTEGSDGGHKGIRSIINSTGTNTFKRIRFGIGKNIDIPSEIYVLNSFSKEEVPIIETSIKNCLEIIDQFILEEPFHLIMNQYN